MWQYNQTQNNNELYHYGVKGMKWGVRRAAKRDAKRIQKSLNKLDQRYAKQAAKYMESTSKKSKSAHDKAEVSQKTMRDIESQQWKLIGEAYSKKYTVIPKDKIRDGRSFLRKFIMSGAAGMSADQAVFKAKYKDKYQTTLRNGRTFNQNPMMIKGNKFKVKAY